jgi:predicted nucleotidyltransferase
MASQHKGYEIPFNKNLNKLMFLFIGTPAKKFTQAEIRKFTDLSKRTVIKWLDALESYSFLKTEHIGRNILYYANLENPVMKQMKILINVSVLYELAVQVAKELEAEVYLYGSAARGEDTEKSDIDLLIIGDKVPRNAVMAKLALLEKQLERKISFQIFTSLEWSQAARKDKPFYERVEKDKIKLA